MTEMAQIDGVERVGSPTAATVLGVGGVRHALQRQRVVLDSVVENFRSLPAKVGEQGIVGVAHKLGRPRRPARADRLGPPLGDRVELAVAVELIPEQVAQHDRLRMQLRRKPVQP